MSQNFFRASSLQAILSLGESEKRPERGTVAFEDQLPRCLPSSAHWIRILSRSTLEMAHQRAPHAFGPKESTVLYIATLRC